MDIKRDNWERVNVHIDRIYQFEQLLIENPWNDQIGYRLYGLAELKMV